MFLSGEQIKKKEKLVLETKNSEHKEGRSYDMLVPPELLERKKKEKKEKKRESGTND